MVRARRLMAEMPPECAEMGSGQESFGRASEKRQRHNFASLHKTAIKSKANRLAGQLSLNDSLKFRPRSFWNPVVGCPWTFWMHNLALQSPPWSSALLNEELDTDNEHSSHSLVHSSLPSLFKVLFVHNPLALEIRRCSSRLDNVPLRKHCSKSKSPA